MKPKSIAVVMCTLTTLYTNPVLGESKTIPDDLNFSRIQSVIRHFRAIVNTTPYGSEIQLLGKIPEKCIEYFKITNSNPSSDHYSEILVRAGILAIRIEDKDGKGRACVAENKCTDNTVKCVSASEIPGAKIPLPDEDLVVSLVTIDREQDGPEALVIEPFKNSSGEILAFQSSATQRKELIAKARRDLEECSKDPSTIDLAIEALDTLFVAGEMDDQSYEKHRQKLEDIKLAGILKSIDEKANTSEDVSDLVDSLIEWHSENNRETEKVAAGIVQLAFKVYNDLEAGESRYKDADEILAKAEGLSGLKKAKKLEISLLRQGLALDEVKAAADLGEAGRERFETLFYGSGGFRANYYKLMFQPGSGNGVYSRVYRSYQSCMQQNRSNQSLCSTVQRHVRAVQFLPLHFSQILMQQQSARRAAEMAMYQGMLQQSSQAHLGNPQIPFSGFPHIEPMTQWEPMFQMK